MILRFWTISGDYFCFAALIFAHRALAALLIAAFAAALIVNFFFFGGSPGFCVFLAFALLRFIPRPSGAVDVGVSVPRMLVSCLCSLSIRSLMEAARRSCAAERSDMFMAESS